MEHHLISNDGGLAGLGFNRETVSLLVSKATVVFIRVYNLSPGRTCNIKSRLASKR